MGPADDKVHFRGKAPRENSRPVRFGGAVLGARRHICAFFNNHDDEYRVLLPFIKAASNAVRRRFHTVDPDRCDEHLQRLAKAGIDVAGARESGQFELRTWNDMHLHNGRFDQDKTLALLKDIVKEAKRQGFPLSRFVTHMEWALENRSGVDVLSSLCAKPEE
jgi:MEDS: MEthanogen/methylotroph, DcmR Sensory domain